MPKYDYAVVTTSFEDNHGGEKMLTAMAKEDWRLVQLVREGKAVYFYMERVAQEGGREMFFEGWREKRGEKKRIREIRRIAREEKVLAIEIQRAIAEVRKASEEEVTPKEQNSLLPFSHWESAEEKLPFDLKVWEVPVGMAMMGKLSWGGFAIKLERVVAELARPVYVGYAGKQVHLCYSVSSLDKPRLLFCIRGGS